MSDSWPIFNIMHPEYDGLERVRVHGDQMLRTLCLPCMTSECN